MGDTSTYFLATGESTGGAFALVDERAPRGMSVPLHLHREDMESFYVLEGEITLYIGDQPGVRASAGLVRPCPRWNRARLLRRVGNRPLSDPDDATARAVLRCDHAALSTRRASPLESIDGQRIHEAAQEYGIEFVGRLPDGTDRGDTPARVPSRR